MRFPSAALVALPAAVWAAPAAAQIELTPTTIEMPPEARGAAIEVANRSGAPIDLQFRAYRWSQPDGGDVLEPTDELVASPAIATVAPGAKQVFRILRVGAAEAGGDGAGSAPERSYRLKLNQLPRFGGEAVAVNLEFSIPVFVTRPGAAPAIEWTRDGGTVTVRNVGDRRVRLGALAIARSGAAPVELKGASPAYVLAGGRRGFALADPAPVNGSERLTGRSDRGAIDVAASTPAPR